MEGLVMEEIKEKKIKILAYCDSPATATGFASVARGIFKHLAETGKYEITIFGINDRGGWKDPKEHPYKIYPTMSVGEDDVYGRLRFINILRGADLEVKPPWDIIFTLNDPFLFEVPLPVLEQGIMGIMQRVIYNLYREKANPKTWFKTISYWPVDSPLKGNWIENAIALPNYSVAYTEYGKREIEKADQALVKSTGVKPRVIYHGVDLGSFKPISDEEKRSFRQKFFKGKVSDHTFVVSMVARNQMRKDIPRAMKIFREFQKRRPDSFLYIHAKESDAWGSLGEYARNFDLEKGRDWTFPGNFNENIGYPTEALNLIYNISDVHLSTTLGEGWGMPISECMAAKTLNLAPQITSIPEIFGIQPNESRGIAELVKDENVRGIPIKSFSTSSEWATYGPTDFERVRPLTNVDDAVQKLIWIYDHPEEVKEVTERAYKWVQQYSWANIANQWDILFTEAYEALEAERRGTYVVSGATVEPTVSEQPEPERDEYRLLQQVEGEHQGNGEVSGIDSLPDSQESIPNS